MILCEWDASEGHPGQSCVHLYARILSTSFISVSIFSVWCYSSVLYLNDLGLLTVQAGFRPGGDIIGESLHSYLQAIHRSLERGAETLYMSAEDLAKGHVP